MNVERHFIGGLLIEPEKIIEVYEIIEPQMLVLPENQKIYKAIYELFNQNKPVDIVTICQHNKTIDTIELMELVKEATTSANLKHHAVILRNAWTLKQANKLKAKDLEGDANEAIEEQITSLQDLLISIEPDELMSDLIDRTLQELIEIREGSKFFFKSGFQKIDKYIGGFAEGEYHIIAARPGVGKTSLALSILLNNLLGEDLPAVFISGEMGDKQIISRLISMYLGIPMYQLKTGDYPKEELTRITDFMGKLQKSNLVIKQISAVSPARFRMLCKKLDKRFKPKVIILDYIQKVTEYGKNRNEDIAKMSQTISDISKELKVPMIILAQINRATMNNHEEPDLHHLRDSGSLEQDCDTCTFIYSKKEGEITNTELLVRKNRNGMTVRFDVNFNKNRVLFHDLDKIPKYVENENPF